MARKAGRLANINPAFWRGKKILLTGHTGFKGSWLGAWLTQLGAKVTGLSLAPSSEPNHFSLLKSDYVHRVGDIRDLALVQRTMKEAQPELIFHLAAQSLVRESYVDPVATYATNVMGTLNILEAARSTSSLRAALIVTSDKCYENRETLQPYRETDAMGGYDPYSSSKGCAEILTSSMRRSFFAEGGVCQIASARAGNVIGGGDWAENRLIPDIARGYAAKKTILIRNPDSIRPWQHVLDPLHGYLQLAEKLFAGRAEFAKGWNFGPSIESAWPVSAILERARKLMPGTEFKLEKAPEHEAKLLTLDSSQAKRELHWTPVWAIDEALSQTFEWYRAFYEQKSVLTSNQIEKYMKDVECSSRNKIEV